MTDPTPPVLAALELAAEDFEAQAARLVDTSTSLGLAQTAREMDAVARLLRELRDVLSGAIARHGELDPETQRKIAAMLEDGA